MPRTSRSSFLVSMPTQATVSRSGWRQLTRDPLHRLRCDFLHALDLRLDGQRSEEELGAAPPAGHGVGIVEARLEIPAIAALGLVELLVQGGARRAAREHASASLTSAGTWRARRRRRSRRARRRRTARARPRRSRRGPARRRAGGAAASTCRRRATRTERAQRRVVGVGLGQRAKQHLHLRLRAFVVARARKRGRRASGGARRLERAAAGRAPEHARERRARLTSPRCRPAAPRRRAPCCARRRSDAKWRRTSASEKRSTFSHGPGDAIAERMIAATPSRARQVVDVDVAPVLVEILVASPRGRCAARGRCRRNAGVAKISPKSSSRRLQRLGVQRDLVERVVAPGLGVERAAERLDGVVERVRRRAAAGAAEQHVLEEVRQAVVARASRSASRPART